MQLCDGEYFNRMMVWDNGLCSQGYEFNPPDLRNVSNSMLMEVDDMLRQLLTNLPDTSSIQFSWGCNSDYRMMLHKYDLLTDQFIEKRKKVYLHEGMSEEEAHHKAIMDWCIANRRERSARYKELMLKSQLRKEKLYMYLTVPIKSKKLGLKYSKEDLQVTRNFFDEFTSRIKGIFGIVAPIHEMEEQDYFQHQLEFFNPSLENILLDEFPEYNPNRSILDNTYKSDIVGHQRTDLEPYNLFFDSHYHCIGAVEKWPKVTFPGIIFLLTSQSWIDYRVVINIYPLDVQTEIKKCEKVIRKNQSILTRKSHKTSLKDAANKAAARVKLLGDGDILPIRAEMIVHCWSRDKMLASRRFTALQNSVEKMKSGKLSCPELDSTAISLLAKSMPAGSFQKYQHYAKYCDSHYISALIPFSSTFTGMEKNPEAIYDGDNNNLVAVANFSGGAPQHAVLFGMTGAGKSAQMNDLLAQTAELYDCEIIIEQGGSFCLYTQAREAKSIFIYNETDIQINYFDTGKAPLASYKLSSATETVMQMVGITGDVEKDNARRGLINILIKDLYMQFAEDWAILHPQTANEAALLAHAVTRYREKYMPQGTSNSDAFFEYMESRELHKEIFENISEAEIMILRQSPKTEELFLSFCYAFFKPEEYPTHSDLIQYIMIHQDRSIMTEDEQRMLIKLLQVWGAGGQYGNLFDGPTNVELHRQMSEDLRKGNTIHFELGLIHDHDELLKQMASVLIMDFASQFIMSLPRHWRKRFLCDEAGSFMRTASGQQIIARYYEQMRKYSTHVQIMVQNYSQFKDLPIRATIMNQCSQFFLLKIGDKEDLEDLCAANENDKGLEIPKVTQHTIWKKYPIPKKLIERGVEPYNNMCYFHRSDEINLIGTVKNTCSPEMLTVASSSTESYEELMKQTKRLMGEGKTFIEAIQQI